MDDSAHFMKSTPSIVLVYPFNTVHVCYKHIDDVHVDVW